MTGELVLILRILLAGTLLTIVSLAFYVLWKDLRSQTQLMSSLQVPSLELSLEDGENQRVKRYTIPEIKIGRDPSCDYRVIDETVSGKHARFMFHHGQWWVEDLQSTNGTFINQAPLDTPTVVISGDEIRCGQVNLKVKIDGQP